MRSVGPRDLGNQPHLMHAPDPRPHPRSPGGRSEVEGLGRLELAPEAASWVWTIDTSGNRNLDTILAVLVSSSCHASTYTFVNGKRYLRG